jgi:hypothetical protein
MNERFTNEMHNLHSDMNAWFGEMSARLTSLEGRITAMWIITMGTIIAGVIALVVERGS